MYNTPRTIQIFLPNGDPTGIRIAEMTTSILRVIQIPRSLLKTFSSMSEAKQVGLYFLIGGNNEDDLYIGQTGEIGKRLNQHANGEKQWDTAIVVVSMTQNLTQTHVLFLESIAIKHSLEAGRYNLLNGNNGSMPYAPLPLEADCHEIHSLSSTLLSTLGFPIFKKLVSDSSEENEQELFFFTRSGTDATAIYTTDGMVVLKGSKALAKPTVKRIRESDLALREKLMAQGNIKIEGDIAVFVKDTLFKSPSGASTAIVVAASNGWVDFKNAQGKTLSEVYRYKQNK